MIATDARPITALKHLQLLKIQEVQQLTKLSRTTIYSQVREKRFPAPLKIAPKHSRWLESEISDFVENLKTARTAQ